MKRNWTKSFALVAIVALAALAGAGCGDDDDGGAEPGATVRSTPSTDTGAATLRSDLTALLGEHVELAGIAIVKGVQEGLDSPTFDAAAATLDSNSQGLTDAVGSAYGDAAGDQFLELWRSHIGFFVDYAAAKAGGNEAKAAKARRDLDGYRQDFGAFLASANPNLTKQAVAEELKPHVDSLFAAIDSAVAGKPSVFDDIREAAGHMSGTANVLAGAIVAQFPEKFGGESGGSAQEGAAVTIQTFAFEPDPVEVDAGSTIAWTNRDDILHTVTAGTRSRPGGEFDERLDGADTTARVTLKQPGTYRYFCSVHDGMDARVVVG